MLQKVVLCKRKLSSSNALSLFTTHTQRWKCSLWVWETVCTYWFLISLSSHNWRFIYLLGCLHNISPTTRYNAIFQQVTRIESRLHIITEHRKKLDWPLHLLWRVLVNRSGNTFGLKKLKQNEKFQTSSFCMASFLNFTTFSVRSTIIIK